MIIKRWLGSSPVMCNICQSKLEGSFVDGATSRGPWAVMCNYCHQDQGIGLGYGRGQRYDVTTLQKLEG